MEEDSRITMEIQPNRQDKQGRLLERMIDRRHNLLRKMKGRREKSKEPNGSRTRGFTIYRKLNGLDSTWMKSLPSDD